MPANRPRASFKPLPPDLDIRQLVETTENFQYVDRISCDMISQQGVDQFEKLVLLHVIIGGKPLVIDGFDELLDPWTFTPAWLRDNHGQKVENARNLTAKDNLTLTIQHYLKNMGRLTDQYFEAPDNYKDKKRQRIYLKDIDCPPVWQDKLKEHIPQGVFYLNESVGDIGGPGAVDETLPGSTERRRGKGVARAGDLMSCLPPEMRAENLMCYIGHEGTYTPAHREMCASLGQNIMVEASGAVGEDGKVERPGSSLWFMTETKDRHLVSEYWLSVLGHDIEVENHFAQIEAWVHAPFTTYVVEQKPGDFILIPPLAPHQVWNRGTRTMKVAWNRTTVETLEMALNEALPNARMVCRDEQYKNKAIVYYSLAKYSALLRQARAQSETDPETALALRQSSKVRQLQRDFKRLFELYKKIILSEMFWSDGPREHPEFLPFDSNVTCAYCRCNIFNRFLTCKSCTYALGTDVEEPYDICMDCYAMGRSCGCISDLVWCEQWKWKDLLQRYEEWRRQIMEIDGGVTEKTPLPIQEERRYYGKKTLAQICQEQLKLRPWVDITKGPPPEEDEDEDAEVLVNDDGTVKRVVKKKSKAFLHNNKACHVCFHRHPRWKMAKCSQCDLWYCYGSLFRAHDLLPQQIMEDLNWKCPHCRRVCNTGACRRDPRQKPYQPKGTLLGHDTKKVADVRSVECLVDFSVSNQNWLRDAHAPPHESSRILHRQAEAELAKSNDPTLDDRFLDHYARPFEIPDDIVFESEDSPSRTGYFQVVDNEDSLIDPALLGGEPSGNGTQQIVADANGHIAEDERDAEGEFEAEYLYGGDQVHSQDVGSMSLDNGPYFHHSGFNSINNPKPTTSKRPNEDDPIRLVTSSKRRKKGDGKNQGEPRAVPLSGPAGRFRKEQVKKQVEDARKAGRYIIAWGAMHGKKKVITLKMDPAKLVAKLAELARGRGGPPPSQPSNTPSGVDVILQSDVVPPPDALATRASKPKVAQNQFRYRVEDDEDFARSRKRGKEEMKKASKKAKRYEEITLGSDEEDDVEEYVPRSSTKRRVSNWLSKKNEGDDDLPTELPPDFKDGQVNPRQRKSRPSLPGRRPVGFKKGNTAKGLARASQQSTHEDYSRAKIAAAAWAESDRADSSTPVERTGPVEISSGVEESSDESSGDDVIPGRNPSVPAVVIQVGPSNAKRR